MEIGTLVKQRYPIKLYLNGIRQVRTLHFQFDDNIAQSFRMSLRALLSDMTIDAIGKVRYGKDIQFHFSYCDPNQQLMQIRCTGDVDLTIRLEGESTLYSAAWSIYALAIGADWFNNSTHCAVNVKTFSLEQQLLAKSLQQGINIHRFGDISEKGKNKLIDTFKSYICQIAKEYTLKAPSFSFLPVPTMRLNDIKRKLLRDTTYQEVLRQLDCNIFYLKDMSAYADMIRMDPEYCEKLKTYVNYLMNDVCYLPMDDIGSVIMSASRSLKHDYSETYHEAVERMKLKLEERCSPGFLTSGKFRSMYAIFDEVTGMVAYEKLRLTILEDLSECFMEVYNARVQAVKAELTGFTSPDLLYIRADVIPPQDMNWQRIGEYTPDSFSVPKFTWNHKGGGLLADIIQGGYQVPPGYSCTWLCGEESASIMGEITPTNSRVIRGLNNQLLVAFMVNLN